MGTPILVVTAFALAAAPAAGGQPGNGSPAQPGIQAQVEAPTQVAPRMQDAPGPTAPPLAAPTTAPVPAPLPRYNSPLNDYRPYRVDEPLLPWRDANDAVGRLGGHMGHLTPSSQGGER